MSACDHCRHNSDCFEQRGRCADFETEKQYKKRIRRQIESINEAEAPLAVRTIPANQTNQGEPFGDD